MKKCLLLLITGLLFHLPASAELKKIDKLKAAYIFNFTHFIKWPDGQPMPLTLCMEDNPELSDFLIRLIASKNNLTRKNPLRVVPLSHTTPCDIAFLSSAAPGYPLALDGALIISDNPTVRHPHSVFTFFEHNNRLRFEINMANASALDLSISSELLKVATIR